MVTNNALGIELNSKSPEELKKSAEEYADSVEISLNPDEKTVDGVVQGLLKNKDKHGEIYCPCRRVTGNKEKDKEIICPCIFGRGEIELQNHCHCNLFVKKKGK